MLPQTTKKLIIRKPDDWHLHLRDGAILKAVAPYSANYFSRAIIMPNLIPPIVTTADALAYRNKILDALPENIEFKPLMTLYLTEKTKTSDVVAGFNNGLIKAVKLYPAGATTNSQSGVQDLNKVMKIFEKMAEIRLPLCIHGEITDKQVDIFDREAIFIDQVLDPLHRRIPELRIVLEHLTTRNAIDYVRCTNENLAGTITVHHLIINRNHILSNGIHPHYYCLPVAKREQHRLALREAATSGEKKFFLGTDSAPHTDNNKESSCGCAGIFTAINSINCLAHIFEEEGKLDRLEKFCSINGSEFYGFSPNQKNLVLEKRPDPLIFPKKITTQSGSITVFNPGFPVHWHVNNQSIA